MFCKLIAIASIAAISNSADKQYVATFVKDNNGISGKVIVENGQITMNLDLSSEPDFPTGFDTCTTGGLSYHIHAKWTHNDTKEGLGSDCGADFTGGHYDPWNACGGASGNSYCLAADGTASDGNCIPKADYSVDFPADPFSVEVGDWSSKYGKVTLDAEKLLILTGSSSNSFYEVLPEEVEDLSIVFHCSGSERAFCASFEMGTSDATETVPDQVTTKTVVAEFTKLSSDSKITLYPNGDVDVVIDATSAEDDRKQAGCTSFEYSIFKPGTVTEDSLGNDCDGLGDQYDPTYQCLPWSESDYCALGKLCSDSSYEYICDFDADRYSCAPGDLSGKMGNIDATSKYEKMTEGPDTLIPPTDHLIGKFIGINCAYSSGDTIPKFLACAPIKELDDSISSISATFAIIVSFIAFLY